MQASEADSSHSRNFTFFSQLWFVIAALCGCVLLAGALWYVSATESYKGRDCGQKLPWKSAHISVESADAYWKKGSDDARMALRSDFYPVARVKLSELEGAGMLFISFHDIFGRQVGDTVNLSYCDGALQHRDEAWVKTTDKTVVCRIETGYRDASELDAHFLKQDEPLWRVVVSYRAEGDTKRHKLGFACVQPELKKEREE